jgi:hypothetical protein
MPVTTKRYQDGWALGRRFAEATRSDARGQRGSRGSQVTDNGAAFCSSLARAGPWVLPSTNAITQRRCIGEVSRRDRALLAGRDGLQLGVSHPD